MRSLSWCVKAYIPDNLIIVEGDMFVVCVNKDCYFW